MGRTPRDLAQALAALAQRPTPALVWRSGAERVELSGRVLVNWVEKTAGLLVDELDVTASDLVTVSPVPHWRLVVIALAALRVGARVEFTHHPEPDAVVHAQLETAPDHDAAAQLTLTVAAAALAFACAEPVAEGEVDFCDEVRGMPDVYSGFETPEPEDVALGSGTTHGNLLAAAAAAAPGATPGIVHLPLADGWEDTELLRLLGTVVAGGAVLVTARAEDATPDVLAQERAEPARD
ncbi:TIGR03089 family protein [Kocuria sp.]|uniref:TIGR03089 family protein n=1 Tax=Kocuria sp. TaxID=1871328 RepID=UPI0026DC3D16|nr:TIGR03089 family protein [Kocuria sp.]MDO4919614.1 TIGR03089 family protein [Kocuria sp.]